jgi:leucine dehydrogenase
MPVTEKDLNKDLIIEKIPVSGYEKIFKITHSESKLKAIVAIHNTKLGGALGGTRICSYGSFENALKDVLRLSKGMTYKSAIAGVGFGGGKAVIIADPKKDKTKDLLKAYGRAVESLQGQYICAEDVGCSPEDLTVINQTTRYAVGLPHEKSSGDPGSFTARGVFRGMQASMQHLCQSDSLEGVKILIQGLGDVGWPLMEFLFWANAHIFVSDIDKEKMKLAERQYGAIPVNLDEVYSFNCDIFSPCAMGAVINDQTLGSLKCKAVVGSANNQLLEDKHAEFLRERKILYAPDFVVNAGGLFNVAAELDSTGYNPKKPRRQTHQIYNVLRTIYEIAEKNRVSTNKAAIDLAEYRIKYKIGKRTDKPCFHHSL